MKRPLLKIGEYAEPTYFCSGILRFGQTKTLTVRIKFTKSQPVLSHTPDEKVGNERATVNSKIALAGMYATVWSTKVVLGTLKAYPKGVRPSPFQD